MLEFSMKRRRVFPLAFLLFAGVLGSLPAAAQDLRGTDRLLGAGPLGFGVDVTSLKRGAGLDTDARLSAVSFDLKLHWPVVSGDDAPLLVRRLEPFVAFGPALIVDRVNLDTPPLADLHAPAESGFSLGVRGGAGLAWQVGKSTSIFGEYSVMRAASDRILRAGGRADTDPTAHDFLYGLSVRF
jgi:hypothetical protein